MQQKILHIPILLLILFTMLALENFHTWAQGRTSGNTRTPGNARPVTGTPSPVPISEGSRDIGRTREPAATIISGTTSGGSRDNGRSNPGLPPVSSPTVDIPQPVPPPQSPYLPPIHDCPEVVIVEGGTVIIDGDVERTGEESGFWIRDDVRYGRNVTLAGNISMPEYSGYDFSELMKRSFDHPFTDMFVEEDADGLMMSVWGDTEIMDLGEVHVPEYVIDAPPLKWSPTHSMPLIPGHEYVVLTWDHHYAKFVVTSMLQKRVVFDWAYQYVTEEPPGITSIELRSPRDGKFQQ